MKRILITFALCLITSIYSFANYSISKRGIEHIKSHESCELTAYWDSNGYSIGYGHHGKDVRKGMRISKSKAEQFLRKDIKNAESAARRLIDNLPYKYKFSQGFFDGLVDMVYNCGEGAVKNSEFYNRLKRCRVKNGKMNTNDFDFTCVSVKNFRTPQKGHKIRRAKTYKMMIG